MNAHTTSAEAPSPKAIQVRRIAEARVAPSTAAALADAFFPTTKRDDCSLLASITAARVSASTVECR